MRRRITINVDDDTSDVDAMNYVLGVVEAGRISDDGKQYSYVTTFKDGGVVYADRTRAGNDSFTVGKDL